MFRTTLAVAAISLLTLPALADHHHGHSHGDRQLLRLADQVRSQMALVRAQTDATFERVRGGRFIAGDIYGELDDLCRELDRLEELASRPIVSRGDFRRLERAVQRIDEQSRDVEGAVRSALADPRRLHGGPSYLSTTQPAYYPGITTNPTGRRGIRLVIGNGKVGVSVAAPQATPYVAARPVSASHHGHGDPAGDALCSMTDDLRLMTRQLVALVLR